MRHLVRDEGRRSEDIPTLFARVEDGLSFVGRPELCRMEDHFCSITFRAFLLDLSHIRCNEHGFLAGKQNRTVAPSSKWAYLLSVDSSSSFSFGAAGKAFGRLWVRTLMDSKAVDRSIPLNEHLQWIQPAKRETIPFTATRPAQTWHCTKSSEPRGGSRRDPQS